jgi:SAM-dependent methyltransferase
MNNEELSRWFEAQSVTLETAYLAGAHPWQQSGVGRHTPRSAQDWEVLRRPIAEGRSRSGTFLDVGCANGYLLECLLRWTQERRVQIIPYGWDFSAQLLALARQRLPQYADQLFVGTAGDWPPPRRFDSVTTMLDYVPDELQEAFVQRLLERCVQVGGTCLSQRIGVETPAYPRSGSTRNSGSGSSRSRWSNRVILSRMYWRKPMLHASGRRLSKTEALERMRV